MRKKINRMKSPSAVLIVFTLFSFIILSGLTFVAAGGLSYTPAAPSGSTEGFVNIEYKYTIYTSTAGASWMFDWGDGVQSGWIKVGESDNSINLSHTWGSYGEFAVRVKLRTSDLVESYWSTPLIVMIYLDTDFDSWIDDIETSYQTNISDPLDYPLDTDSDGTPDEDSPDGEYTGDVNDDNDYFNDVKEDNLGTSSKNALDVKLINIEGMDYYLLDTTGDGTYNFFYNNISGNTSALGNNEDDAYLIDIDSDGLWDYTYDSSSGTLSTYVYEEEEESSFEIPFWIVIVLAIVITVLVVIFLLFRLGIFYTYEVEEGGDYEEYEEYDGYEDDDDYEEEYSEEDEKE